jgi:hypothetical protein
VRQMTIIGTLRDQSWYNPLDVAKGHRGFLNGDFVMMLYAWSPNWRLNKVGNDRYELYIRRSFDGATDLDDPAQKFTHWDPNDKTKYGGDGTVTCETFRSSQTQAGGDLIEPRVCNSYGAGVSRAGAQRDPAPVHADHHLRPALRHHRVAAGRAQHAGSVRQRDQPLRRGRP